MNQNRPNRTSLNLNEAKPNVLSGLVKVLFVSCSSRDEREGRKGHDNVNHTCARAMKNTKKRSQMRREERQELRKQREELRKKRVMCAEIETARTYRLRKRPNPMKFSHSGLKRSKKKHAKAKEILHARVSRRKATAMGKLP